MILSLTFSLTCVSMCTLILGATNEHVGIHGDQTVGGVHLFEVHSPSGGMGLRLKLLLLLAVVLLAGYWCLRQRAKKVAQTTLMANAMAGNPLGHCMIPMQQMAALQAPPSSSCSHSRRVGAMDERSI